MTSSTKNVEQAYALAKDRYAELGVDVDEALNRLSAIPISLHCWQGDDVGGFENAGLELGGGLAVTGNYPGKATTADELRADIDKVLSLVPGTHRLNLHAIYAETGGKKVERDEIDARALQELDRLGQVEEDGDGLQPHVLRPSQGERRLHPGAPERGHPQVLDRPRHRSAARSARRSARRWDRPA